MEPDLSTLSSTQCLLLSDEDLSLISMLPLLTTLRIGSICGVHHPDRSQLPSPPSLNLPAAIGSDLKAYQKTTAYGDQTAGKLRYMGLPRLRHLHIAPERRPSQERGIPVRELNWLLGPDARLESLSPSPVLLNTDCGDFSDQALTISCLIQLLAGPMSRCSSSLALSGMLGFSTYNCSYMFHSLQVTWD